MTWREAPGFWQRHAGVASDDGTTITGTRDSPFGQLKILGSEKAPLATSMM
jgi:hypothetical protein